MVSNEVKKTENGKFAPERSLCFDNIATCFIPLKNFVFRQIVFLELNEVTKVTEIKEAKGKT